MKRSILATYCLFCCNNVVKKFLFTIGILSALFCTRSMHRNKAINLDRFARSASAVRILYTVILYMLLGIGDSCKPLLPRNDYVFVLTGKRRGRLS